MKKIRKPDDLAKLRQEINKRKKGKKSCITISSGTCGQARGSLKLIEAFEKEIKRRGLKDKVLIKVTGCHGFCEVEPVVIINSEETYYQKVSPEDVKEIINETVLKKKVVERLLYTDPVTGEKVRSQEDIPFYNKQLRHLMGNNQLIDPTRIEDYIAIGGYSALARVLTRISPEEVIEEVKKSGLRGRGGAGFPTGYKWSFCRKAKGGIKYIICNADEGDPGAYMDRSLLEGNPHSIIEGMIIGAYAIGASEGFIYVRTEYPLAVQNARIALEQAREHGFLGENIFDSGFNFDIKIKRGAGAFVCGEETALMASIEGKRGEPRQRPPFPVQKGLWGKPTNINNVETWANVPLIINKGADWYSKIGTDKSKGTKIFSLVGKIKNTGLVEVPMGIKLQEIIYDIGGGIPKDKKFKAVQTGGPSGGCIPAELLNLPVDYEQLTKAGTIMGSGGMIVMDENTCMVDVAKYFLNFLQDESCGKCFSCRKGIQRMKEIVTDITEGKGKEEDLELLEELANVVKDTSLCGLGQTASNPVLSTLRYFRDEYEAHIKYKRCESAVCDQIISSPCQHTCPISQEAPIYIGLLAQGEFKQALEIIRKDNPLPSICGRVCPHPCEDKCTSGEGGDPIAIRALKRFATDYGMKNKIKYPPCARIRKDDKVAIVGSGPAGLSAGYFLAQKGYNVTIFESHPVPGGMLAVGIPEHRLPKEILNYDIENIRKTGVEIKTNVTIGKDIELDELFKKEYKAVFIATGAHRSMSLGCPGEEKTDGVLKSMEFLTGVNLGKEVKLGKRVGVIGGGNAAVDAARVARRLEGVEKVTIVYRRTRKEMPAYKEEVEAALDEGIEIRFLTAPIKVLSQNGKLIGIECQKMELGEMDKSGRRAPVPIKGSEFKIELDTLISAIGEKPDISYLKKGSKIETSDKNTIVIDQETFATNREGVFAGGDVVTGPNNVIDAIAAGKIATESIDKYVRGESLAREYKVTRPSVYVAPVELTEKEMAETKRPLMPSLYPKERTKNFKEIEKGYTRKMAIKEARRCLRCDLKVKKEEEKKEILAVNIKVAS